MTAFFQYFLPICLLRKGPQDLPWSLGLLCQATLLQWVSTVAVFSLKVPLTSAIYQAFIALCIHLTVGLIVLGVMNKLNRLVQVLTAIQGALTIINLSVWPLIFLIGTQANATAMLGLVSLTIILWSIAIHSHILHHALEWNKAFTLPLAIALFVIRYIAFVQLTS